MSRSTAHSLRATARAQGQEASLGVQGRSKMSKGQLQRAVDNKKALAALVRAPRVAEPRALAVVRGVYCITEGKGVAARAGPLSPPPAPRATRLCAPGCQ